MRLIDADELKKCAIPCEIHNGALTDLCVPLYQINNALTIKPQIDYSTNEELYRLIISGGQENTRPQGHWE